MNAARAHDLDVFEMTRAEKASGLPGSTRRFRSITPLLTFVLLTGMPLNEAVTLTWEQVDLEANEIYLRGASTKTKQARTIDLSVSPALVAMLAKMKPDEATGSVFGLTRDDAMAAGKRLHRYRAPATFTWQALRRTCGPYLANAPGSSVRRVRTARPSNSVTQSMLPSATTSASCASRRAQQRWRRRWNSTSETQTELPRSGSALKQRSLQTNRPRTRRTRCRPRHQVGDRPNGRDPNARKPCQNAAVEGGVVPARQPFREQRGVRGVRTDCSCIRH